MTKKTEKPLDRKNLRAAVGINHDPLDIRLEVGDPIPDNIPDKDLRPLVAGGAVVEVEPEEPKKASTDAKTEKGK